MGQQAPSLAATGGKNRGASDLCPDFPGMTGIDDSAPGFDP
jgi:hypothetical protein